MSSIEPHDQHKSTLLRFVSSEISSHASNILGFSVLLFAFLSMVNGFFEERIALTPPFCLTTESLRYVAVLLILTLLCTGVFYTFMRLVFWGRLSTKILINENKAMTTLINLWNDVKDTEKWENKRFFGLPLKLWSGGIASDPRGLLLSFFIGLITSLILFWIFLIQ